MLLLSFTQLDSHRFELSNTSQAVSMQTINTLCDAITACEGNITHLHYQQLSEFSPHFALRVRVNHREQQKAIRQWLVAQSDFKVENKQLEQRASTPLSH